MPQSTDPLPETPTCDTVLDGLEAYLDHFDGSCGTEEGLPAEPAERLAAVSAHLETCPACARELALAERIRSGLRSLPEPEPGVTGLPQRDAPGTGAGHTAAKHRRSQSAPLPVWVGAAVAVAAVAIVIALVLTVRTPPPAPTPRFSAAEVARAEAETRYAFARVAEISQRTGRELRDDILARRVAAPTTAAVVRSLDLHLGLRSEPPSPPTGDPR